jgi:YidC/Oxa1 family membrane protein insertase
LSKLVSYLAQFFNYIKGFISVAVPNDGLAYFLAVVIFTGLVRLILLPLNTKQMRSQTKINEVQPLLKKLQEKYKNDPTKLQAETMALYKEKGISPFSSCLPLLIQMPLLFALFYVFRDLKGIEGVKFLWVTLSKPDPYYILPIISGATTYIQSAMMAPKSEDGKPNQMATMNIGMSIFMVFISIRFTSLLILYWIINNLYQILQNYYIKMSDKKKETV